MHTFVYLTLALIILLLGAHVNITSAQFFYHQTLLGADVGGLRQVQRQQHFSAFHAEAVSPYQPLHGAAPHPSVVANSQWEAELPPELSKSARFYSDPHIAAGLAEQSLLTNKEMPVVDREAEKIPREQVFKIFKNAGFIKRR